MDVAQRHTPLAVHRHEIADHALDEAVRRLERRVHHVVVVVLGRSVHRAVVGIAEPVLRVRLHGPDRGARMTDRKSTRLNSSHGYISYAVFCLKKKKQQIRSDREYPPFDRATRDGYAVPSKEAAAGAKLKCVGEIKAGDTLKEALAAGT